MDIKNYQVAVERTLLDKPQNTITQDKLEIVVRSMKMFILLSQYIDKMKKIIFHEHEEFIAPKAHTELMSIVSKMHSIVIADIDISGYDYCEIMKLWTNYGLIGEVGEMSHITLNKFLKREDYDLITEKLIVNELGDCFWYLVALTLKSNHQVEGVLDANNEKLVKRFPNGFTSKNSLERKDL